MALKKLSEEDIKLETLIRLTLFADKYENADDVINRLVDTVLGFDCQHTDQAIYMEAVHDEKGYLDISKTLKCLDDLRHGKQTTGLIRVCKQCMRGRKIEL